jgi:nucleotide-binding universal stress UspA family protein
MIAIRKILVPTDFSENAHHALRYGCSFAREYEAELVVLHVVEDIAVSYASDLFPVPMAHVFQELSGYARAELQKLVQEAADKGLKARELLAQGRPSSEIVRLAREEAIDLVVLGTHGKGVLDQALFGSTTERVVRNAPCPVLTVRPSVHQCVKDED